ncbi:ion channel [Legionella birminghamensis]
MIYYSFVTLTTIGYSDILPLSFFVHRFDLPINY